MKRLFMLRDVATNEPFMGIPRDNGPLTFSSKKEAKERRDEVNRLWAEADIGIKLKVSFGPDHPKFKK